MKTDTYTANLPDNSLMQLVNLTRIGLKQKSVHNLAKSLNINVSELSKYLPISERTLQRYPSNKTLSKTLSDHILQIQKALKKAINVFEDDGKAVEWLKHDNIALGSIKPIDLFDTYSGIEMVSDELSRIEYGVFA